MSNGTDDFTREEIVVYNKKLKKSVLDVLFQVTDTFYVHCMPDPQLIIGKRGLVDKETKDGIILVFGPYSTRHLSWDDDFIYTEMQFNNVWEYITIPFESIFRTFDKNGQILMQWTTFESTERQEDEKKSAHLSLAGKIKTAQNDDTVQEAVEESKEEEVPEKDTESADTAKTRPIDGKKSTVIEVDFAARRKHNDD